MPTAKLFVRDLTVEEEGGRLERALKALPGVHGAVASATDRCVEVDFEDDEVGLGELLEAAARAGFDASLAG